MSNEFAMNLIYLRGEKNLTQQQLGDAIGVSPSQISRYEAGQARPRKTVLRKLADALGVEIEQLSNPQMEKIVMDEIGSDGGDRTWEVAVPKPLLDKIKEGAKELGISAELMFLAELERAQALSRTGSDPGIEQAIEWARQYHKPI